MSSVIQNGVKVTQVALDGQVDQKVQAAVDKAAAQLVAEQGRKVSPAPPGMRPSIGQ